MYLPQVPTCVSAPCTHAAHAARHVAHHLGNAARHVGHYAHHAHRAVHRIAHHPVIAPCLPVCKAAAVAGGLILAPTLLPTGQPQGGEVYGGPGVDNAAEQGGGGPGGGYGAPGGYGYGGGAPGIGGGSWLAPGPAEAFGYAGAPWFTSAALPAPEALIQATTQLVSYPSPSETYTTGGQPTVVTSVVVNTPEPASWTLVVMALLSLALLRRRNMVKILSPARR